MSSLLKNRMIAVLVLILPIWAPHSFAASSIECSFKELASSSQPDVSERAYRHLESKSKTEVKDDFAIFQESMQILLHHGGREDSAATGAAQQLEAIYERQFDRYLNRMANHYRGNSAQRTRFLLGRKREISGTHKDLCVAEQRALEWGAEFASTAFVKGTESLRENKDAEVLHRYVMAEKSDLDKSNGRPSIAEETRQRFSENLPNVERIRKAARSHEVEKVLELRKTEVVQTVHQQADRIAARAKAFSEKTYNKSQILRSLSMINSRMDHHRSEMEKLLSRFDQIKDNPEEAIKTFERLLTVYRHIAFLWERATVLRKNAGFFKSDKANWETVKESSRVSLKIFSGIFQRMHDLARSAHTWPPETASQIRTRLKSLQNTLSAQLARANEAYKKADKTYQLAIIRNQDIEAVHKALTRVQNAYAGTKPFELALSTVETTFEHLSGWNDKLQDTVKRARENPEIEYDLSHVPEQQRDEFRTQHAENLQPFDWSKYTVGSFQILDPLAAIHAEYQAKHARAKKRLDQLVGFIGAADRLSDAIRYHSTDNLRAEMKSFEYLDREGQIRRGPEIIRLACNILNHRNIPYALRDVDVSVIRNGKLVSVKAQEIVLLEQDPNTKFGQGMNSLMSRGTSVVFNPYQLTDGTAAAYATASRKIYLPVKEITDHWNRHEHTFHEVDHFHRLTRDIPDTPDNPRHLSRISLDKDTDLEGGLSVIHDDSYNNYQNAGEVDAKHAETLLWLYRKRSYKNFPTQGFWGVEDPAHGMENRADQNYHLMDQVLFHHPNLMEAVTVTEVKTTNQRPPFDRGPDGSKVTTVSVHIPSDNGKIIVPLIITADMAGKGTTIGELAPQLRERVIMAQKYALVRSLQAKAIQEWKTHDSQTELETALKLQKLRQTIMGIGPLNSKGFPVRHDLGWIAPPHPSSE